MADVDRHVPPPPGPLRTFSLPAVVPARLGNGLEIRVARTPRLPLVTFAVVLPAGEASVGRDEAGVAVLTGDALEGGTRRHSGVQLAEALEGLGARLGVGTGWDSTRVTVSCLADRKEEALALLAEVLTRPAFPAHEVDRGREQRLARIRQRKMTPATLAADVGARRIYADGVPYARPLAGTEESVAGMDRDRLATFAGARYRPSGAALVAVGDVDPAEVRSAVEEALGGWEGVAPPPPDTAATPRRPERTLRVVHRPGAVQSEIRLGHPGPPRSTPDYLPLLVGNLVLGGTFSSRLNLSLREEHGFTYGIRSTFSFRRSAGPFGISTAVATDVTAPAVGEIFEVVEGLLRNGLTPDETASSRDYLAGVFPLRMETTGQIAGRLAELFVYDLPDDWYLHYRDRIRAVSRPEAEEALSRHLRPERAQVVVVGDADEVAAPLEALGLGPVSIEDAPS